MKIGKSRDNRVAISKAIRPLGRSQNAVNNTLFESRDKFLARGVITISTTSANCRNEVFLILSVRQKKFEFVAMIQFVFRNQILETRAEYSVSGTFAGNSLIVGFFSFHSSILIRNLISDIASHTSFLSFKFMNNLSEKCLSQTLQFLYSTAGDLLYRPSTFRAITHFLHLK